jgi:DNA primase
MEILEIKSHLPLKDVLSHYGLKPDKHLRLNCPFHDDKTPSLQVYYKTHTCYCFSASCPTHGKSMDVIDFILHKENCSKREAILKAKTLIQGTQSPAVALTRAAVLTKMFIYFKNAIHNSGPAKAYLESRNLDYQNIEVGYNSGQFHHGARKDQYLIASCLKAGLLLDKGITGRTGEKAYSVFGKGGIVFGLKNLSGQTVGLYFRNIQSKGAGGRHYYLKERQGLYPGYPKEATETLILTEAIIDAASLLQQPAITKDCEILSLYGTNGLGDEHRSAIKRLEALKEIIFWLDGDAAGAAAVEKYHPMLAQIKPEIRFSQVITPKGEDVNSLLQGHDAGILESLLRHREPLKASSSFFILSNEKTHDPDKQPPGSEIAKNGYKLPQGHEQQGIGVLDSSNPDNLIYQGGLAQYRIKGFKASQLDSLKVSLQILGGSQVIRAKIELYDYKQTEAISRKAAKVLDSQAAMIAQDLSHLTTHLEAYVQNGQKQEKKSETVEVPQAKRSQCLAFLKAPDYFEKLGTLIGETGVIGEEMNRLLLYVIASTYKSEDTLHALVQGSSGSGKTHLITKIAELMPPEHTIPLTRVTESSLYNYGEKELKNKLLIMEDLDGLKEEAFLAFRELQSRGELNSSTSIKNEQGNIEAARKRVCGPIASLSATTKGEVYEDNMSRSLVIAVDESPAQTKRVIHYQNRRASGEVDQQQEKQTIRLLQDCMRLLRPLPVVNPFAGKVQLPEEAHKIRRLNRLYQSFVKQITILHQYQRERDKQGRLITEKADLKYACHILFECIVLKVDELDGSLRDYFEQLKAYVKAKGQDYAFTRMEIRHALKVSKTRQHVFMQELLDFEYIRPAGGFANKGYRYNISYWDSLEAMRAKIQAHLEQQLERI